MAIYSLERASKQRIIRQSKKQRAETGWREVEIVDTDTTPSWKRYGKGCANMRVTAGINCDGVASLSIVTSETALPDKVFDQKRATTKQAFFTAYGEAAFEIYELLREAFEPKVGPS